MITGLNFSTNKTRKFSGRTKINRFGQKGSISSSPSPGFQRNSQPKLPHVVILGGGFGGIYAAQQLAKAPVRITLIDKQNHHLFQPLLYQVATGGLGAPDIASPIRKILRRQRNVTVFMDSAQKIEADQKRILLGNGEISYDYLIVATGVISSYHGHEGWASHAPGLKTLKDAFRIREKIYLAYERAEHEPDPAKRKEWLTFVVVGGGPTGIELAGTIAEIAHKTLAQNFKNFDPKKETRVILIEGSERIAASFHPQSSHRALEQLQSLGVEIRTRLRVSQIADWGVEIGGEKINARTVLWSAGVKATPITKTLGVELDSVDRVLVQADLSIPQYPDIFVVGDAAHIEHKGQVITGVAPVAIQGGKLAAKNILHRIRNEPAEIFHYKDHGHMATIGRKRAIAELGRFRFSGGLAWLAWLGVHLFWLIGHRNRFVVLTEWIYSYFTYQRRARVVIPESREDLESKA